jgi:hypothetical protein
MNAPASITITPVLVADLWVEGERMPVYVHVIDHPDARVLVDTGMTELHPAMADMDPRLRPLSEPDFDLAGIDIVVNTHLHADHCGGNHLFAGKPSYVQRRELDDARSMDGYTVREWVEAPGVQYVPVDGEHELLGKASPGVSLGIAPAVIDPAPPVESLRGLIRSVIEQIAGTGDAVIVSHAASHALATREDTLRILVTAGPGTRVARVRTARKLSEKEAEKHIARGDTNRADYIKRFYGVSPELPTHYDIVLNSDRLSVDQAVEIIVRAASADAAPAPITEASTP